MNTSGINNNIQLIDKSNNQNDIANANVNSTKQGIINLSHEKILKNIDFQKKDLIYFQKSLMSSNITNEEKAEDEKVKETAVEKWNRLTQRFGIEDLKLLSEEGIDYTDYDVNQLNKTVDRIKEERSIKEENLENQIEAKKEKLDLVRSSYGGSKIKKEIIKRLEDKGLPITESNIEKISNALEMSVVVGDLSDQAMSYLITYDLPLTIENLYKGMHISYDNKQNLDIQSNTYGDLASLETQMYRIIEDSGLEVNDDNIKNAKWLLKNEIPVTEGNLYKLIDLKTIKKEMNQQEILDRIISNVEEGLSLEKTDLTLTPYRKLNDIIDEFHNIDDSTLDFAYHQDKEDNLNLTQLREVKKEFEFSDNKEFDIASVSLRRNLEEIRLKLTVSSGKQLIKNGFNLETNKLSQIVDGLREIENKYYKSLLEEQSVPTTSENVDYVKTMVTSIDELQNMPAAILGKTLSSMYTHTVASLLEEGKNSIAKMQLANKSYETLMTKADGYYGDKIEKAFSSSIEEILKDLELERNEENQRAVRVLGYNSMEITKESINSIKVYDNQVNYMMNNLFPSTVVSFIKKGLNPLNMPIADINIEIKRERLNTESIQEEKFSKYLWELERNQDILENEKESYIGFYRLMHQLSKNGEAALGAVIQTGQEVTLNNLLTAMRIRNHGEIDISIDEEFGALENFSKATKDIDIQINEGFIDKIYEEISPEKINFLENKEIYDMPIEQLNGQLSQIDNKESLEKNYYSEQAKEVQELIKNNTDIIKYLENLKIPASINNIRAATDQLSQDQSFYKLLRVINKDSQLLDNSSLEKLDYESISNQLINNFNSSDDLSLEYENIEKHINDVSKYLLENETFSFEKARSLQRITSGISFIKLLSKKEHYQIPILAGETVTNVNLTILRNQEKKGKIKVNLFSEKLGAVAIKLQVGGKGLTGFITSDNIKGLEILKAGKEEMIERLEEQGVSCGDIYCFIETNNNIYNSEEVDQNSKEQAKEDTKTLYKISKEILLFIRDMETENHFIR